MSLPTRGLFVMSDVAKRVRNAVTVLDVIVAVLLACGPAFSQGGSTGRIAGAVNDTTGGVISGATVSVTDTERGTTRTLTTDQAGAYNAPELIPGTYIVRAQFPGFKSTERRNILVEVGKEYRIDLVVEPGAQSEQVTVAADVAPVETTSGVLGGTISNQLILDLPVQGRNFQKLLELRPGTYLAPGSGKWSLSSNGMRREHNVYILNGMDTIEGFSSQSVVNATPIFGDATSIVPIDAIQEFNTQQVPKAEYGWKPGAVVNVGLRSGSNTLHGTAYAFGRTDALDARNPFIQSGSPKQLTQIEDFGATAGGPIKRDKLFFFVGYEGQRNTIGAPSGSLTLPTRAPLGNTGQSVLDACNALPASNPPSNLSLKMAGLVYNGPGNCAKDPGNTGVFQDRNTVTYSVAPIGIANLHNGLAKIDYQINSKHTIAGEYFIGNYEGLGPQNNAAAQDYWSTFTHAKSMVTGLHWTWLPTSSVVNELRGGFNRENQLSYPGDCNDIAHPDYSYLANMNSNSSRTGAGLPANCGFPSITITPFSVTGCCSTFPKIQGPDWTQQIIDNLSYIRGRHSLKFGGEQRHLTYNGGTYSGTRGSFNFTSLTNFLTGTLNPATPPAVLLGQPARNIHEWAVAGFAQDDWRITSQFTLNAGLRYETVTPIAEQNNQLANFDPKSPTGLVQLGHGLGSLWRRTNDFSPRLGFAWDIGGKGKWVIRGGASIIYVIEGFNVFVSQQGVSALGVNAIPTGALLNGAQGPGDITTASVQFTSGVNWNLAGPVFPSSGVVRCDSPLNTTPAGANKPCAITGVDPNLRRPYASSWNFSLQRAISNNLSLQIAYVGTHGTGLIGLNDINAPQPGAGWLTGAACNTPYTTAQITGSAASSANCENLNRPYFGRFPYFSNINYISNQDFSNYNGMQVTVTQRPWHGLSYLLGYTWAHALDEAGGDWNGAALPSNLFNVRSDYGNSADDVRHRMTLSMTYALPEKKGFAQLAEGWKLNAVANLQSALPWSVADTTDDISGVGGKTDKWDFYGNPSAFSGLGYAAVPYYSGTTNADCVAKAAALDGGRTPLYPGYTYSSSLAKYGCWARSGSMLLAPAIGAYGNMARNLFRGRGLKLLDMSLSKELKFTERLGGQFRFEVFNILNKTQYTPAVNGNPASRTNPLLGSSRATPDVQISNPEVGSGAARSIQLGLKLQF
ncbi:MAG: hypothetical protein C5B51_24850 [Terriglobia bacterium]|nr:MAG: hypothetical protein C5B51_24850 [Terriglobia bacterium]